MERVSTLMDGELEDHEAEREWGQSRNNPDVREAWNTYHLIGDALRGQAGLSVEVLDRVSVRLADEPTVVAPRRRKKPLARVALSLAASVCGVAVVAWLAIYNNPFVAGPETTRIVAQATNDATAPASVQVAAAPASSSMNDYLIAHQEFSPSTAMQGMVSYVRTVSARDTAR